MTSDFSRFQKAIVPNPPVNRQTVSTNAQDVSQASKKQPYPQRYHTHPSPSQVTVPEGGRGTSENILSQGIGRLTIATQPHNNQTINVVLFGEPGVGKSSVVNLIARKNIARVPSGIDGCTLQSSRYDISMDDMNICVFETVGLQEPEFRGNGYLAVLEKAYEFVNKLGAAGGVHLLLLCMRRSRLTATTQNNYRLFSEVAFQKRVPIALVVTGLEGEVDMEDWWTKNKADMERYGLKSNGHACVTTVSDRTLLQDQNYAESQRRIRELLKSCRLKTPASLPESQDWFLHLGIGIKQFIDKNGKLTRGDIMNTLTTRLKLDSRTAQRFLDMMERGGVQQSGRSAESRTQDGPLAGIARQDSKGVADPSKSDTTRRSRGLDSGKGSDEPQRAGLAEITRTAHATDMGKRDHVPLRRRTTGEVGAVQSPYSNKVAAEPRKVNAATETYSRSEMDVSMEEMLRNFPRDLTGHVTRSSKFPFTSGGYGDIYRGKFSMSGKSIDKLDSC
ncbi:hypothetical protein EV363DRAFT_1394927 [Boletus edulis]|nr:hypothetical protein EV363DRAFT_1394927 [Boletus edulis]